MSFGSKSSSKSSHTDNNNSKTTNRTSWRLLMMAILVVTIAVVIIVIFSVANEDIDENDNNISRAIDHEIKGILIIDSTAPTVKDNEVSSSSATTSTSNTASSSSSMIGDNQSEVTMDTTSDEKAIEVNTTSPTVTTVTTTLPTNLNMVYFGNSLLYVNDCPGLIKEMILAKNETTLQQDSCLQGGATFETLWVKSGCSLLKPFIIPGDNDNKNYDDYQEMELANIQGFHDWDYIIMQDQSQYPARRWTRHISKESIRTKYGPLTLRTNDKNKRTIPIILQTAAYRSEGVQYSEDLGTFDNFTDQLMKGAQKYADTFNEVLFTGRGDNITDNQLLYSFGARIAPVGEAYRWLRNNELELYNKLYASDQFHPSQYGTWLQACVVYITCFRMIPPIYNPEWMSDLSTEEASTLRRTACLIAGFDC